MAGAEANTVAVTADPATSMAPQETNSDVDKVQPQEQIATQGKDGFPFTAKVMGIMFFVYSTMFLDGLIRIIEIIRLVAQRTTPVQTLLL